MKIILQFFISSEGGKKKYRPILVTNWPSSQKRNSKDFIPFVQTLRKIYKLKHSICRGSKLRGSQISRLHLSGLLLSFLLLTKVKLEEVSEACLHLKLRNNQRHPVFCSLNSVSWDKITYQSTQKRVCPAGSL